MAYSRRRKPKMSAKHRKAISQGLKRFHRGGKRKTTHKKRKSPYRSGYYGSFPTTPFFSSGWNHGFKHNTGSINGFTAGRRMGRRK